MSRTSAGKATRVTRNVERHQNSCTLIVSLMADGSGCAVLAVQDPVSHKHHFTRLGLRPFPDGSKASLAVALVEAAREAQVDEESQLALF